MSGSLDRKKLHALFDELSDELRLQGARAQIYIVGGAAMSLAFSRERTTQDVDVDADRRGARPADGGRAEGRPEARAGGFVAQRASDVGNSSFGGLAGENIV